MDPPPPRVEPPHDREDVTALVVVVGAAVSSGQARLSLSRLVTKIEGLRHEPLRGAGGEGFEAGNSLGGKAEGSQLLIFARQQQLSLGFLFPRRQRHHQPSSATPVPGRQGLG